MSNPAVVITGGRCGAAESVLFRPAVEWVMDYLRGAGITDVLLTERVENIGSFEDINLTNGIRDVADFVREQTGDLLIVFGDLPLLSAETVARAQNIHTGGNNNVTTIKTESREVGAVWCHKEIFLDFSRKGIALRPDVYGATPVPRSAVCFPICEEELLRAEDKLSLFRINNFLRKKIIRQFAAAGVEISDGAGVTISRGVVIGEGTVIHKGTVIKQGCVIGEGCELGPDTVLENCELGNGVTINASQAEDSVIGNGARIGPYSHIRPNSKIGENVKIGNFVEVKNSVVGEGTSVAHLTYIGDTDCGSRVNWGCGCVTVNYDGKGKYRTTIGDDCFIGCNVNLIAPVTVEDGAYIAAGSTITETVPQKALAIARSRQTVKTQWKK